MTPAQDGLFAHHYRSGVVVYPSFRGLTPTRMSREALDTFCWSYLPKPGDTVLDIGAGIGEEALTFSRLVGSTGRVICVEAQPSTFQRLRATITLNKLLNVTLIQAAISDTIGTLRIEDAATDSHVGAALTDSGGVEVPAETLDALTERLTLDRIDLLKMNIEGAERPALTAANDTLRRTANVAISCHDFLVPHGAPPEEVATYEMVRTLLEEHGFLLQSRPDDERPWIPYYVYGVGTTGAGTGT